MIQVDITRLDTHIITPIFHLTRISSYMQSHIPPFITFTQLLLPITSLFFYIATCT